MDNRIFNVNGSDDSLLLDTLKLVFNQRGTTASYWVKDTEYGIVLLSWKDKRATAFPNDMTADMVFPLVLAYLDSEDASKCEMNGWDSNYDHDGHNSMGWRVYCGDWGDLGGYSGTICAIKPAYMWHGK